MIVLSDSFIIIITEFNINGKDEKVSGLFNMDGTGVSNFFFFLRTNNFSEVLLVLVARPMKLFLFDISTLPDFNLAYHSFYCRTTCHSSAVQMTDETLFCPLSQLLLLALTNILKELDVLFCSADKTDLKL